MILIFFSIRKVDKTNLSYLQSPQVGDIYRIKLEDETYSAMKVNWVGTTWVVTLPSDYYANKMKGVSELISDYGFTMSGEFLTLDWLMEAYEEGRIYYVQRWIRFLINESLK